MAWLIYRICHADKVTAVPAKQDTDGENDEVAQNPSASEDARVPGDAIPTDADTQDHVEEDYAWRSKKLSDTFKKIGAKIFFLSVNTSILMSFSNVFFFMSIQT